MQYTKQKEVGDDLSVCVLNILSKANNLPRLLPINLVKVKYRFFEQSRDPVLVT